MSKNKNALAGLSTLSLLALLLGACAGSGADATGETPSEQELILGHFLSGYRATGTYTESYDYPEGLGVDSSSEGGFVRDYAFVKEEDGSLTNAVREVEETGDTVHFEREDGAAVQETLSATNEVSTIVETVYLAPALYSDYYRDPWDYVAPKDLVKQGSDYVYTLSESKATFLLSEFFGIGNHANGATLTIENGYPAHLSFDVADKELALPSGTSYAYVTLSYEAEISFSPEFPEITHISPLAYENPELEAALNATASAESYAIHVSSNAAYADAVYYVTAEGVYYHADASSDYLVEGDAYYSVSRGGWINQWNYDGTQWVAGSNITGGLSAILPDYEGTLPEQYVRSGESNTYVLDPLACPLNATTLIPAAFDYIEEDGISASVTVSNGYLSSVSSSCGYTGYEVSVTAMFSGYGSTAFPGYFDPSDI